MRVFQKSRSNRTTELTGRGDYIQLSIQSIKSAAARTEAVIIFRDLSFLAGLASALFTRYQVAR
jgi:hypothetical protein